MFEPHTKAAVDGVKIKGTAFLSTMFAHDGWCLTVQHDDEHVADKMPLGHVVLPNSCNAVLILDDLQNQFGNLASRCFKPPLLSVFESLHY